MKQLLIVSDTTLNHGLSAGSGANSSKKVATDLSGLYAGAITMGELGAEYALAGVASKNFWIALGRPNGQVPFLIPEVDIHSLTIEKSTPVAATTFQAVVTLPDPDDVAELIPTTSRVISPIQEYGIVFIKRGAVPHERNTYSVQVATQVDSASLLGDKLEDAINAKTSENFPFTASNSSGTLTITCQNAGEDWDIKFFDCLEVLNGTPAYTKTGSGSAAMITGYKIGPSGSETVDVTLGRKAIGDKADIQDLASRCAAGKGFTDVYRDGDTIYPGYPEAVADTTYYVYTLRFRVGRDSAKTRDERVWQIVHIAVPAAASTLLDAMLPTGKYMNAVMDAIGDKSVTDAAAAAESNG